MKDIRKYRAFPSDLDLAGSFHRVVEYFTECGYKEDADSCDRVKLILRLSESRNIQVGTFKEFFKVLGEYPRPRMIFLHTHWKAKREWIGLEMSVDSSSIEVEVDSSELNVLSGIHDRVREIFQASVPTPERSPSSFRRELKKTVFLAHRFDGTGKDVAAIVSTFLRRLGFEVVEGEGYEANNVPEKVAKRIQSQDIFLCVGTAGDQSWLLSEAAFAKGLGKYMILLLEQGVTFNKGIIGADYEYLSFAPGFIEKAFNDLLFALPS